MRITDKHKKNIMKGQVVRLVLWAMLLCGILPVHAEHVTVLTTRADGTKLLDKTTLQTGTSYGTNIIRLMPDEEFQTMDGFGYALTYSSCYNLMKMAGHERRELLRRTFSPTEGFGVGYTRISIGCSDFSSKVYTLCDKKGIENFALTKDETDYVIPVLREVLAINPNLKIMASPWTCPKWMKVKEIGSGTPYDSWTGGRLNPSYYATYAQYFVKFIEAFRSAGVPIYAVTPQNEPLHSGNCASLFLPWEDEAALISHMAPAFKRAGLNTKIYCFDHNYNYDNVAGQEDYPVKVYNALSGEMEGSELVVGSAWHNYGGSPSELDDIHQQAPDKEIVFTEASIGTWNDGRNLQARLIDDMKNLIISTVSRQCRAVVVWNMMLDLNRGPNLDGGCTTCYGALDIDPKNYHTVTANSHYYIMAHASMAARQGAVRIATKGSSIGKVSHVAFKNADGTYGVVILNEDTGNKNISVLVSTDAIARISVPAKSVVSVVLGGKPEAAPLLDGQRMTSTGQRTYALSMEMVQGQCYEPSFKVSAEDGWYADPDFFEATPSGSLKWLPLSGKYRVEADLDARALMAFPEASPLDHSGQGALYVNGPRRSIGKPCFFLDDEWLPAQAMPMAEVEDGLYRLTVTVGEQLNDEHTDFAFFTSPQMETPFVTQAGSHFRLAMNEEESDQFFALGTGTNGHADGHLYKRHFFFRLTKGDRYVMTVDLRNGTDQGILTIKKSDGTADGVRNPLVPLDTETGNVYDMNGRRVWGKPQKGVYIRQGKKTLVK